MIIINFKIYSQTFGDQALKLAKIIKDLSANSKPKIIIAASALDAYRLKEFTGQEVWLQNIDEYSEGKHNGWVSPLQAQSLNINGSLLNHSEHRLPRGTVQKILSHKPKNFKIVCCAHSLDQISWIKKSNPDYILFEPPELIASSDKSVATEMSASIKNAVALASPIPLIVGAGVKSSEDVRVSRQLGAVGVCLSSAFVTGADPQKLLTELINGFGDII